MTEQNGFHMFPHTSGRVAVSVPSKSKTTPFSLGFVTFLWAPIFLRVVLKGMSANSQRQDGMDTLGAPSSNQNSRAEHGYKTVSQGKTLQSHASEPCSSKKCRLYQHRPRIAWKRIINFLQFVSNRFKKYTFLYIDISGQEKK